MTESPFDERGALQEAAQGALPDELDDARRAYIARYTDFFAGASLAGKRLLVYQHSAVGSDLLVEILDRLGAEVIPAGRSDTFVPIDTENIEADQLAIIQKLADEAAAEHGPLDAVVSTDGDSDRPLILGVDPKTGRVRFFGGDLVGMIVAEYLHADAVVVPISCNDGIDRGEPRAGARAQDQDRLALRDCRDGSRAAQREESEFAAGRPTAGFSPAPICGGAARC